MNPTTVLLDDALAADLGRFATASRVTKSAIMRRAIAAFIQSELAGNAGIRERFERYKREDEAAARRLVEALDARRRLRVVK